MQAKSLFLIGLGGASGSVLRYFIGYQIGRLFGQASFPWGTFFVNFLGCLIMGLLLGLWGPGPGKEGMRFLLLTGFCGGFTTFSAFAFESLKLMNGPSPVTGALYLVGSLATGLLAMGLGIWTGKALC